MGSTQSVKGKDAGDYVKTQPEGFDYHSVARSPMLFTSVATLTFSCHAVLFTRGSGGITLLYKRTAH